MLDLAEIPFFAALSPESLERLRQHIPLHHYAQGEIIARVGEPGRYFQAIAAGAVRVQADADSTGQWRGFILGPGQIFGEMSLFTGMPIAATLLAARDTSTYRLEGDDFLTLLDREPALHHSLTRLLIERLRHHNRSEHRRPGLALITSTDADIPLGRMTRVLAAAVAHYAPGSELFGATPSVRQDFDAHTIERWRAGSSREQYLVVAVPAPRMRALSHLLLPEDAVIEVLNTASSRDETVTAQRRAGAADYSRLFLGDRPLNDMGRWSFHVPHTEFEQAARVGDHWNRGRAPNLDHVARYVTFREVGIALSSGAARGFAHLGVLETLEAHGVPIDFLCGTSMGAITALTIAHSANAAVGGQRMREYLGGNRKVRDTAWWPRASVFMGHRVARAAHAVFAESTFADLRIPVTVVASDLASADRAIIDSGPIVPAVLGTSAIPGFYPPVTSGPRILVDGAIVSRVPVDILDRRRCGLRLAVNVVAVPSHDVAHQQLRRGRLRRHLDRFFGFQYVLGTSWEVLASYGSSLEALRADLVITPETHSQGGPFDFDKFETMIASGRAAALERMDAIKGAVRAMLEGRYR